MHKFLLNHTEERDTISQEQNTEDEMRVKHLGIFVMAVAVLLMFGCAKKATTVTTPGGGTVTSTTGGGETTTTVTTPEGGTITAKGNATVTEEEVGVPFYPGAAQNPEKTTKISGSGDGKTGEMIMISLSTTDSFDKVVEFYKSKMPKNAQLIQMNANGEQQASWNLTEDKTSKLVQVSIKDGATLILIHKMSESK